MYDRFDLDEGAEYSCCFGDPAAPVQMVQVIYCDIVADMKFVVLCPLCQFVDAQAFCFFFSAW